MSGQRRKTDQENTRKYQRLPRNTKKDNLKKTLNRVQESTELLAHHQERTRSQIEARIRKRCMH